MSLDKAMKNLKFDKRLTEWYINNGQLTKEELEAHLKDLPDMAHNVELSDSKDEADELDKEFSQH
ncbi:MAG: hypothetical protein ACXWRE_05995 [Pseudobdellovibrionaceae bacterium]